MAEFLADTYALFEYVAGKKPFTQLLASATFATTSLNVAEFAHGLRKRGVEQVEQYCTPLIPYVIDPPPRVALEAARFRFERQAAGADCSTVDAWGYATARFLGVPFLTGDEALRGFPGVKFVKG